MRHTKLSTAPCCPRCGGVQDCWWNMDGAVPEAGDLSICLYCSAVMLLTEDLGVRSPTVEELLECDLVDLARLQRLVLEIRAGMQEPPG